MNQEKSNVVFVAPHPDDIELFCGGTLLEHSSKNDKIVVILMTKGGKGTLNPFLKEKKLEAIREKEAHARYKLINNVALIFAGFKDANVSYDEASLASINNLLTLHLPDIIYIPEFLPDFSHYHHNDHVNTGKLFSKALLQLQKKVRVRCYHSKETNLFIPIKPAHYELNNEAVKFYKSQDRFLSNGPFAVSRLNRTYNKKRHQWGKVSGYGLAEGFREFNL